MASSRLDARLIDRTTRSVALTDAGMRLAERLRPAMNEITHAVGEFSDREGQLRGRISISTMEYGGRLLIGHAVGEFQAMHSGVEIELCVDARWSTSSPTGTTLVSASTIRSRPTW